jgi:hypothetical protein
MDGDNPLRNPAFILRAGLVVLLLVLLFGPYWLRATVPIWIPFLILAGLELNFFVGAIRAEPPGPPNRGPQAVDQELYGYQGAFEDEPALWSDDEPNEIEPAPAAPYRRRPWRRLATAAAVLAALALAFWITDSRTGWDGLDESTQAEATERFAVEASAIADKPVTVECDEAGEHVGAVQHADGAAQVGGEVAYLTPERCYDLYRLALKDEVNGSQTARSIAVLAHEAWHLRGVANEGETECFAFQSGVVLGRRLGLSEDRARQMMSQQLAENALRSGPGVEYVVPPECRDGGPLDLNPETSRFP